MQWPPLVSAPWALIPPAMPYPLETRLAEAWPPAAWADVTVLVAVSGGADSVALLRAMAALKTGGDGRLCAAHLNHKLRPDADDDQRFVVDLCGRLNLPCEVGSADAAELAATSGDGIEAAAREVRYDFLQQAAGRLGARFIATAHTADDQAETVLHRIIRGTGIRGLSGMARARPLGHAVLIRPLLGVRRAELVAYVDALGQPYRHDSSNLDPRFTRNRIRRHLLPRLQRHFNAEIVDAILRLGTLAGEVQAVIDDDVDAWFERCVTVDGRGEVRLELALLAGRPRYLVRELLMAVWRRSGWPMQAMGMLKWDELCDLTTPDAPAVKRIFPGNVLVEVAAGEMRLARVSPLSDSGLPG
jgi:tRNA(Ile)-lysidine synthase